jgi:hypothetical protein
MRSRDVRVRQAQSRYVAAPGRQWDGRGGAARLPRHREATKEGVRVDYVWFSLGFVAIHLGAYIASGAVSLRFTKDLYTGDSALFAPFLRDVDAPEERTRQGMVMWPAQLTRGLLMSIVLYPILTTLAELSLPARFGFLAALMFVYADLAAATPFSNNIEGLVYMKKRFVRPDVFWRIQSESIVYSILFGGVAAWALF